jgi:hypothetical protein
MPFGTTIFNTSLVSFLDICFSKRFLGTFHFYSGFVFDALAEIWKSRKCKIMLGPDDLLIHSHPVLKTWNKSCNKVYLVDIPKWFDLLHPLYKDVKKMKYQQYLESPGYIQAKMISKSRFFSIFKKLLPI